MANIFNSYSAVVPKKNKFNLNHSYKFTCEMGTLIPVLVQDVIPNDSFRLSMSSLIRFAPLIAPIMSEVDVYFHAFFVPERIVWDKTEDFFTGAHKGKQLPSDSIPQRPRLHFTGDGAEFLSNDQTGDSEVGRSMNGGLRVRSLADYLGFQTVSKNYLQSDRSDVYLDAMPFRVYQKIWLDYYRDENLTYDTYTRSDGSTVDGVDLLDEVFEQSGDLEITGASEYAEVLMNLRKRAWRKDYFTSALPFPQKGDDVAIPSTESGIYDFTVGNSQSQTGIDVYTGGSTVTTANTVYTHNVGNNTIGLQLFKPVSGDTVNIDQIRLKLNTPINEATIRDLRRAYAAQAFLERRAVGGSRYQEQNYAMFGIKGSDARLQRAEFLGGIKNPVVVSQLLQTSESTSTSALGTPAGNAVSAGNGFVFNKTFNEYGWIMVIMSVVPRADYMSGTPRMYLRKDLYDFYWPQFAKIGEQPIYAAELYTEYISPSASISDYSDYVNYKTFGYTPRYAEYRFRNNRIGGDFKESLNFWTLARSFSAAPVLNGSFVECNPSTRVFAVEDTDYSHLWCECFFKLDAVRPIPKYAENV